MPLGARERCLRTYHSQPALGALSTAGSTAHVRRQGPGRGTRGLCVHPNLPVPAAALLLPGRLPLPLPPLLRSWNRWCCRPAAPCRAAATWTARRRCRWRPRQAPASSAAPPTTTSATPGPCASPMLHAVRVLSTRTCMPAAWILVHVHMCFADIDSCAVCVMSCCALACARMRAVSSQLFWHKWHEYTVRNKVHASDVMAVFDADAYPRQGGTTHAAVCYCAVPGPRKTL